MRRRSWVCRRDYFSGNGRIKGGGGSNKEICGGMIHIFPSCSCGSSNPLLRSSFSLYGVWIFYTVQTRQSQNRTFGAYRGFATVLLMCRRSLHAFAHSQNHASTCGSSNPLLRSSFSLYGVRRMSELIRVVICKLARITALTSSAARANYSQNFND